MGIGIKLGAITCFPYLSKRRKVGNTSRKFSKSYIHKNLYEKTLKSLVSQYNINLRKAEAMFLYAQYKSLFNASDKITGNYHRIKDKLLQYIDFNLIDVEFKKAIDDLHEKIKDVKTVKKRQNLLFSEMLAYMQVRHKREIVVDKVTDVILDVESKMTKPFSYLFSKWWFWLATSVLAFDVLDSHAKQKTHDVEIENETIKYNTENFYAYAKYMSKTEKIAWKIYDDFIEEIGREIIAAGINDILYRTLSRGARLLANSVLTLASFHPAVRGVRTIGLAVRAVANILEGSFILRLASQPFIEWKLEGWLAMHEWKFLRAFRESMVDSKFKKMSEEDKIKIQNHFYEQYKSLQFAIAMKKNITDLFSLSNIPFSLRKEYENRIREIRDAYAQVIDVDNIGSGEWSYDEGITEDGYYIMKEKKGELIECQYNDDVTRQRSLYYRDVFRKYRYFDTEQYLSSKQFQKVWFVNDICDIAFSEVLINIDTYNEKCTKLMAEKAKKNVYDFSFILSSLFEYSENYSKEIKNITEDIVSHKREVSFLDGVLYNTVNIVVKRKPLIIYMPKYHVRVGPFLKDLNFLQVNEILNCISITKSKIDNYINKLNILNRSKYQMFLGKAWKFMDYYGFNYAVGSLEQAISSYSVTKLTYHRYSGENLEMQEGYIITNNNMRTGYYNTIKFMFLSNERIEKLNFDIDFDVKKMKSKKIKRAKVLCVK